MAFMTTALTLLLLISATRGQQADVIQTTLGRVQGLRETVLGKDYDVYWGIPFAKPPLGNLRFKHPEAADPWNGILSADTKPNSCYQGIDTAFEMFSGVNMWNPNTNVSEDCLYLNVWVPRAFGTQPPSTTMVWIFGGGFWAGTSTLDVYNGAKLAVTENVIVASMNYRLGPLGFLYTGTTDAPGNQGLLDQTLALKWIYENIVSFGGQQNSITIFGESAGAVSVGLHLMSNLSQDYFTRAILQSGSPTADWGMMSHATATARAEILSEALNCPVSSSSSMVQCLRGLDAGDITIKQWNVQTTGAWFDTTMSPVVDNYFIMNEPSTLMAEGDVKDTELLIGVNKDEGMYWLLYAFPNMFPLNNSGTISAAEFRDLVKSLTLNADDDVVNAVINEYVGSTGSVDTQTYRDIADDISGDMAFICSTVEFAKDFAALGGNRDVYLYYFKHNLSNNPWPDWTGVMHGYEIEAVFALPQESTYTQQDRNVAARVTGYWSRFATTGNPNAAGSTLWPKLTSQNDGYLRIKQQGDSVGHGLRQSECSVLSTHDLIM